MPDVDMTVPIIVQGLEIGEFGISVDVTILSYGDAGTYWDPPEPAEWETGDVHFYGKKIGDDPPRWEEHPLPVELQKWTDAYLEGDAAAETIGQHIADMQDDDY